MKKKNGGAVTTTIEGVAPKAAFGSGVEFPGGVGWNYGYKNASPALFGDGNILFAPSLLSANREIIWQRKQAVANSRYVDRNNGSIKAGVSKAAVGMVGPAIRLQSLPNYKALGLDAKWAAEFAQQWENEFSLWAEDPRCLNDAERHYQFGGQMLLGARNAKGPDGEVAMIVRYDEARQAEYGARYATFLEVLDPDRISTPPDQSAREGDNIVQGRVLDNYGAMKGFYVQVNHPSESNRQAQDWVYVPREDSAGRAVGIHWFFKYRAQAQRGMSGIIASLRKSKMLDQYDDAKLERAVLNAMLSIFVKTNMPSDQVLAKLQTRTPTAGTGDPLADMWDLRFDVYDQLKLQANGARIPVLPLGDEITMSSVNAGADDDSSFRAAFGRAFASEIGLSYEQFTGDYSQTTYAGARSGLIDQWRGVTCERHLFTQATAALIGMAVLEECIATGKIVLPRGAPDFWKNITAYAQCNFMGPGMGWVDPLNEVKAAKMRVEEGFSSRTYEASLQGQDHRDIVDARAAEEEYAKQAGVGFGSQVTPADQAANDAAALAAEAQRQPGSAGGGGGGGGGGQAGGGQESRK